jgi:hypothetical protein
MDLNKIMPPRNPIIITSGVDRYGFSSLLAKRLNLKHVPRSFANWVHGWSWWTDHSAESLMCHDLPADTMIIVTNYAEKEALISEGFKNVKSGGLPFAYVNKQHNFRNSDALLVFPPHSAEVEKLTNNQKTYFEYVESIKNDFSDVYVSIHYLDLNTSIHQAALAHGLKIIEGANPRDANGLIRVRCLLDSFKFVTTNNIGSHVLYALYAGCNFSFAGPIYSFSADELISNDNPHRYTTEHIDNTLIVLSEAYIRTNFSKFVVGHPFMGSQDVSYAVESIGEKFILQPSEIMDALGWSLTGQLRGYVNGATRRMLRHFNHG